MATRNGGVVPCIIESCRYPTRTARATLKQFPNTRSRRGGGMCHVCHYHSLPKPAPKTKRTADPDAQPRPETMAGLNTFLAERRAREAKAARRMYPGMATPRRTA